MELNGRINYIWIMPQSHRTTPTIRIFFILLLLVSWSTATHAQQERFKFLGEHSDDVEVVSVCPNGKFIATGSWDKTIKVFETDSSFSWYQSLIGHQSAVTCLDFSRDGEMILSGGKDYRIILWRHIEEGTGYYQDTVFGTVHTSPITDVIIGPTKRMIYSAGADGKIMVYDLLKKKARIIDNKSPIRDICLSTNRRFIYCVDETTLVKQYDAFGRVVKTFEGHEDYVNAVVYSLNNKYLVTASSDKTAIVWNPLTGDPIHKLEGHDWKVTDLAITMDSRYLLTGSTDGSAKLWDLNDGSEVRSFDGNGSNVRSVAFSRNSKYVFIALHTSEQEDEYGVGVWMSGIEPPKAGTITNGGRARQLPPHLQKYAPKTSSNAKAAPRKKASPKPSKGKVIEETDEVKIMQD